MRYILSNLRPTVLALTLGLILGSAVQALAVIPNPTGPTDPSQAIPVTIAQVNAYLGSLVSKWSGATSELQFSGSQSWAVNSTVATAQTSVGPQGSHTTVQEWLVVVNPSGTVRFIPAY